MGKAQFANFNIFGKEWNYSDNGDNDNDGNAVQNNASIQLGWKGTENVTKELKLDKTSAHPICFIMATNALWPSHFSQQYAGTVLQIWRSE